MASDDLSRLTRWVEAGGEWRVTRLTTDQVDLELVTCAGDEVMESFSSVDADLLAYVSAREAPPTGRGASD